MKELELVSKTTPAVVSFNYVEIDAQLDITLKKYSGLVFTEETLKECKKTLTELKKGQKSLSDFRIKTKKLLSEDIEKFENQCKKLSDKFDTVINPINKQADEFEVTRIANKRAEIQAIINTLTDERFLEYKYYNQLVITKQMLNKGTTIKAITTDLTSQADILLSHQNIEEANIELIKSKVELANVQYGVTLLDNLYLELLNDGKDTNSLIEMINENAEKTKIAAEEAEAELLAIETRKAERAIKIEVEKVAQEARIKEAQEAQEAIRLVEVERQNQVYAESEREAEKQKEFKQVIGIHKAEAVKVIIQSPPENEVVTEPVAMATETYTVTGTEAQLDALEEYLNTNAYDWI